ILGNLTNPALSAADVAVLEAVVRQGDTAAAHWGQVEKLCAGTPRTLIHGDYAPKNMRVRTGPAGTVLPPFAWGSAGWGVPAADLVQAAPTVSGAGPALAAYWASPDLAVYGTVVRESGLPVDAGDLRPLAAVGKLFRCLICINLDAQSFATDWVADAARKMRVYRAEMADALRAAGWPEGGGGPVG